MSKKIMYGAIASFLLLVVTGCLAAPAANPAPAMVEKEVAVTQVVEKAASGGANYAEDAGPAVTVEHLIIRSAWLDLVVPDTEKALTEIEDVTSEMGGYIVQSNVYQSGESKSGQVQLRIPAEKLDEALERFRGLATEVRSENISGQDVAEEYVDLESRLRSKEAAEAKLLQFLAEAEDTEAALTVYTELERIQTDIEVIKGRMQYLEQSAAMSSVTIQLTPDALARPIEVGGWHPEGTLRDAVEALIRVLQFLVDALIVIVVVVLPVVVVVFGPLVGLFFLVRAIVRRRRTRKIAE
jgi:hypothetical protein